MKDPSKTRMTIGNNILSSLPAAEFDFLVARMEPVTLANGTMIANAGDTLCRCYFPNSGMISLLSVTETGKAVEVGYTGREGMVGLTAVLGKREMPYQALVQAGSDGFFIDADVVAELFGRCGVFHDAVLRYAYVVLRQISQTAVCNHFHTIQARLCRWMTVMSERSGKRNLTLTQEFIAHMLGVQRTSVGMIATAMQADGLIRYRRGKVEILDFDRMRNSSCECYFVIENEMTEYMNIKNYAKMSDARQTRVLT
ncbi:MAG: Crp/Fnr family transcriptional regulator [Acidobacteriota bacterium]